MRDSADCYRDPTPCLHFVPSAAAVAAGHAGIASVGIVVGIASSAVVRVEGCSPLKI